MSAPPRVIGLVSWWDESPVWLAATVSSLSRFCDHVIAVDGRYALYPDARVQSGIDQVDAVIEAARASGMGCTVHTAPATFDDEMKKRTLMFQIGALYALTHHDCFFVLDGDEVVVESPEKRDVLSALEHATDTGASVVTTTLFERTDPHANAQRTDLGMKLPLEWRYECGTPRFWRAHANMRVVGYHYNYLAEDENGETLELWGQDGVVVNRPPWDSLNGRVVIENRNRLRNKQRDADRAAYYKDRDATGLEVTAPLVELARREAYCEAG
jgi:hypothetical protein